MLLWKGMREMAEMGKTTRERGREREIGLDWIGLASGFSASEVQF